jgi:hypothetical protein
MPPQLAAHELANVLRDTWEFPLAPGTSNIQPGVGFDLRNPLTPNRASLRPFTYQFVNPDEVDLRDDLLGAVPSFETVTSVRQGLMRQAASFALSVPFLDLNAAYEEERAQLESSQTMYFSVAVNTPGVTIPPSAVSWANSPVSEEPLLTDDQRVSTFLSLYGSHYVSEVKYGTRLSVRARCFERSESSRNRLRAALDAVGLFWSGSASYDQASMNFLSESSCRVEATIICGRIAPIRSIYVIGLEQAKQLLSGLRNGSIAVFGGPLVCVAKSFLPTLLPYPASRRALSGVVAPASTVIANGGVPIGAIIPWLPPEEALVRDSVSNVILDVIPPVGWRLCRGNGAIDLVDKVPVGCLPRDIGAVSDGRVTIPALGVTTTVDGFTTPKQPHGPLLGPGVGSGWGNYHRLTSTGQTDATRFNSHKGQSFY